MLKPEAAKLFEDAGAYFANLASNGVAIKRHGRMCDDCAFKRGSSSNIDPETLIKLESALIYEMASFNCHTKYLDDAGTPCIGFLHAKEYVKV